MYIFFNFNFAYINKKDLAKKYPNLFTEPTIHGMLEFDWKYWLEKKKLVIYLISL